MSRNSQAKRAARAKQRARQRSQDQGRSGTRDRPATDWTTVFGESLRETPREHAARLLRAISVQHPSSIVRELSELPTAEVYGAAGDFLLDCIREVYGSGWLPDELVRQARLGGDASVGDLCRWSMAAERAEPGLAGADPRWAQHFEASDPPLLDRADRWVERWARWRRFPDTDNVAMLVRFLDILYRLPPVPLLVTPPPGTPTRQRVVGMVQAENDPVLSRVRGLLAKAESTEHEAEAASFTAKAHELMTRHAIDLAAVQQAEHHDPGRPGMIRIPVDPPYPDAKALLLQTVAEQTRCKALFFKELQLSSVVGFPTDLAAVELLLTSLLVQAQHALAQASAGAAPGSPARSSSYRSAFFQGFTGRIGARLAEVNRLAYADEAAGTFLPVLRSQEERIDEFIEAELGGEAMRSRVRGGYDAAGYQRGVLAGDAAELTSGAVRSA